MGSRDEEPKQRPLHAESAEQAVLGALLVNNDAWDLVSGSLTRDHFFFEQHVLVFESIARLIQERRQADVLTVTEDLRGRGKLELVGGFMAVHELAESTPSAANIRIYADIVKDKAQLRWLQNFAQQLGARVREANGVDARMLLNQASELLSGIAMSATGQRGLLKPISVALEEMLHMLDRDSEQAKDRGIAGIPTGFDDLDKQVGGLKPGQLIVVAGRPGMGKTAFAVSVCENIALRSKLPCAVFSMEMGQAEVAARVVSSLSRVHGLRIAHGTINNEESDRIASVMPHAMKAPIHICEDGGLTLTEISAGARKFKREQGEIGAIVVDYFGLMRVERPTSNHAQDLAAISGGLKALAKEVKAPIILLAQLNREVEKRGDKRPVLSDLRDSGGLEQDADLVMMLYRDHVYHDDASATDAEILIRKQRNGPTGRARLYYDGPCTRFRNPKEVSQ